LLQTKGLMEVVILTIFRADGLISKRVFSALILMSPVCTTLTTPLTSWTLGRRGLPGAAGDAFHSPSIDARTPD
jgi:hypothetical protein